MANKYEICSRACVLVGARPIAGFTSASTEEVVSEQLYDSVVDNLLASYRWRFASRYVDLSRLAVTPPLDWEGVYQLPAGVTVIHGCYVGDKRVDFDRSEDTLLVMAGATDTVTLLAGFRPEEENFPPYFTTALELKLAAMFAVPLADDSQKAGVYEGMALRQLAAARSIESQGRTPSKVPVGGLKAYHGGRA